MAPTSSATGTCPRDPRPAVAFLGHGADPVGRIQLMEFDAPNRKLVRPPDIRRATGLFNLNIYASDMAKDYAKLKSQGFNFWSQPARNNFGPAVGETLEAAFDGPDGVVINLIQLLSDDPKTVIGHIVKFIAQYGRTPTGFTSVVTTAHGVLDMEKALAFYYGPLHMSLFIESVLKGAETNRALCLPEDSPDPERAGPGCPRVRQDRPGDADELRGPEPGARCRAAEHRLPGPVLPGRQPRRDRQGLRRCGRGGVLGADGTSTCRAAASARPCWSATRAVGRCRNCSRSLSLVAAERTRQSAPARTP